MVLVGFFVIVIKLIDFGTSYICIGIASRFDNTGCCVVDMDILKDNGI